MKDKELPKKAPLYPMNQQELAFLKKWTDEMLECGKISPASSPISFGIFLVDKNASKEKKGRTPKYRVVVDYRPLNAIAQKDRYPLPLVEELQDRIGNSCLFTKIDLRWGFVPQSHGKVPRVEDSVQHSLWSVSI